MVNIIVYIGLVNGQVCGILQNCLVSLTLTLYAKVHGRKRKWWAGEVANF